jgi:hypothetical protein
VLALVHAHGDPNSPFVHKEMAEIREVVEFERANADVTYFELLNPKMINRTHIGVFTQIWSQLTGMVRILSVFLFMIYRFSLLPRAKNALKSASLEGAMPLILLIPHNITDSVLRSQLLTLTFHRTS